MTTKTLTWVSNVGDTPDKYGNLYVNVSFDDGTAGYIAGRPEKAVGHQVALTALLEIESEFSLEPKGQTQKGADKFKITAYPGYEPAPQDGGGSKREYVPRFTDTAEGFAAEQASIRASVALKAAVKLHASMVVEPAKITATATVFDKWLRETSGAVAEPTLQGKPSDTTAASDPISPKGIASGDQAGSPSASTTTAGTSGEGGAAGTMGKGSGAPLVGHKPGCDFPGVSEFRKDETTPMAPGKLRCTGCDVTLNEKDVA